MKFKIIFRQAFLVCLPLFIIFLLSAYLTRNGGDGATMSFGFGILAPLFLVGLPWSLSTVYFEQSLIEHFSQRTYEVVEVALLFSSIFINASILCKLGAFKILLPMVGLLCLIQIALIV
jgi:hypothetical protein